MLPLEAEAGRARSKPTTMIELTCVTVEMCAVQGGWGEMRTALLSIETDIRRW